MNEPDAVRKSERTRTLLLVGIALVLISTVAAQHIFSERKRQAQAAQAARPDVRAAEALADADRFSLEQDIPKVIEALGRAGVALDEALATQPRERRLLRARLLVARRLAHAHVQLGEHAAARPYLDDAVARAGALFADDRTADRARMDRLATARELAVFLMDAKRFVEAVGVLEGAAAAVAESTEGLSPSESMRGLLADTWLDVARAAAAAKRADEAMKAVHKALEEAEAASERSENPSNALARVYRMASTGATLADELGRPEVEGLEQRVVEIQKLRVEMTPDADAVRRSWSIWLARIADRAVNAGKEDVAESAFAEAVKIRRFLARRRPADMVAQAELVRILNAVGAWHSDRGRSEMALTWYAEAAEAARVLPDDGGRMRVVALGNRAHVLGRLDRIAQARTVAEEAYTLSVALAEGGGADAQVDAARAGLRYARVLRAKPKPKRAPARAVVATEIARLSAAKAGRALEVRTALEALGRELGG